MQKHPAIQKALWNDEKTHSICQLQDSSLPSLTTFIILSKWCLNKKFNTLELSMFHGLFPSKDF